MIPPSRYAIAIGGGGGGSAIVAGSVVVDCEEKSLVSENRRGGSAGVCGPVCDCVAGRGVLCDLLSSGGTKKAAMLRVVRAEIALQSM